jgi:segregation and condensation protein B
MDMLKQHIEAIIFTSEQPTTVKDIQECLMTTYGWEMLKEAIEEELQAIVEKYNDDAFSFELVQIAGGWHFMTKKDYYPTVATYLHQKSRKRLSTSAMETLAIIAYKQPITKTEMESIRGVSCDHTVQKLLEKELITIAGRADGPGKPLLYKTSALFMDYFGINSPKDLPKLKEIEVEENMIGDAPEFEQNAQESLTENQESVATEEVAAAEENNSADTAEN